MMQAIWFTPAVRVICTICRLEPFNARCAAPLRTDMALRLRLLTDGTLQGLTPEGTRHIATLHLNCPPMVERRKMRRLIASALEREAQLQEHDKQLNQEIRAKKQLLRRKIQRRRQM